MEENKTNEIVMDDDHSNSSSKESIKYPLLLTPEAILVNNNSNSNSNSNELYNQIPSAQSYNNIQSIYEEECKSNK